VVSCLLSTTEAIITVYCSVVVLICEVKQWTVCWWHWCRSTYFSQHITLRNSVDVISCLEVIYALRCLMNEFKLHQVSFFLNDMTHKPVIIVAPVNCILVAYLCCNRFCGICFRLSVWTRFKDDIMTSFVLCWEIGISELYWLVIRLLCHSKNGNHILPWLLWLHWRYYRGIIHIHAASQHLLSWMSLWLTSVGLQQWSQPYH